MKRNNGSGSVYKDGNRWVAAVWDPVSKRQVRRKAKSQHEAQKLLRQMLDQRDEGVTLRTAALTLEAYASQWLSRSSNPRKSNTVLLYGQRLRLYIIPALGKKQLGTITVADIEDLLHELKRQGLSKSSVHGVRSTLSAIFSDAVRNRVCRYNPARDAVEPPYAARAKKHPPSTENVQMLLSAAQRLPEGHEAEIGRFVRLLAFTGARFGEVLAMKWSDIDEINRLWTVVRTVSRDVEGKQIVGDSTKTNEVREVLLSDLAWADLKLQRRAVTERRLVSTYWIDEDWVFAGEHGRLRDGSNVRRAVRRLLPAWKFRLHDLRVWFCSYVSEEAGASDIQVSRYVGHSSTRTTKDTYGRRIEEGVKRITDSIDRLFG